MAVDLACDELGVFRDPAEQRRASRVLPRQAEEVQAANVADSAAVAGAPALVEHREREPRVVGPVAGGPDHGVDGELGTVGEGDGRGRGAGDTRPLGDAAARELARARPDQRVAAAQLLAQARVARLLQHAELRQPPEEVAAEDPLRKRLLPRPDREVHAVGRRELLRDLVAGVAAAHDEHDLAGDVAGAAIAGAVQLLNARAERVGDGRDARDLEGTRRDDHLLRLDRVVAEVDDEPIALIRQRADGGVQPDRESEPLDVPLGVGDDLVARRVPVRVAGEVEAGQAVVATRREERERVPALPPGGGDCVRAVEDDEPSSGQGEEVADREARLARADHDDVELLARRVIAAPHRGGRVHS